MSDEKTELPTPKKERDARAKGQVAKSTEVVTASSLLAVVIITWVMFPSLVSQIVALIDKVALLSATDFQDAWPVAITATVGTIVSVMVPILGVALFIAVAANYAQIGSLFALESIAPKLEKINPASGIKRIFSMKHLVEMLKSIIKIVFLSFLLYIVLRDQIGNFIRVPECGMGCLLGLTDATLYRIMAYSALAFIIVAVADLFWQRHSHTKSLMMSKDEVKREYKESEGDPHIKGKRKQLAHELAMGDGGVAARKGTAAVVNPTHYTVIVSYRPESFPLPIITAKGQDLYAHYLRAEAESAGVPVFLNVSLARALYAAPLDQPIPDELFDAVAEVLAWVNRNRDRLYRGVLDHGVIDMAAGDHRKRRDDGPDADGPDFLKRRRPPLGS